MAEPAQVPHHRPGHVLTSHAPDVANRPATEITVNRKTRRAFGRPLLRLSLPLVVLMTAGCDLDSILDVDAPGRVDAGDLEDAALARTLVDGVIGDTECAWNNYVAAASHHSDEWIPASGNLNMANWGQRRIEANDPVMAQGGCEANYGIYTPLHIARFQSEDVFGRLERFDAADVPNKLDLQATARAYGGYALVALGEGFCSMAIDGGPRLTPAEVIALAEARFSDAIELARQSANDDILWMATLGRARARLFLEDFTGAITDAEMIPDGYHKVASRDGAEPRRRNAIFEYLNNADDAIGRHGAVADHFRDLTVDTAGNPTQGSGTPDPRVVVLTRGEAAFDLVTEHWFTDKYTSRADPVPMGSYKEARLIIAEAGARSGDLPTALGIIDERHALAGVPAWTDGASASQNEVIAHVLEERRRELFAEAGHRFNDMLRFRGTALEVQFLGETGSIHPNGLDHKGGDYGTTTCFPLPLVEENGNPNL